MSSTYDVGLILALCLYFTWCWCYSLLLCSWLLWNRTFSNVQYPLAIFKTIILVQGFSGLQRFTEISLKNTSLAWFFSRCDLLLMNLQKNLTSSISKHSIFIGAAGTIQTGVTEFWKKGAGLTEGLEEERRRNSQPKENWRQCSACC